MNVGSHQNRKPKNPTNISWRFPMASKLNVPRAKISKARTLSSLHLQTHVKNNWPLSSWSIQINAVIQTNTTSWHLRGIHSENELHQSSFRRNWRNSSTCWRKSMETKTLKGKNRKKSTHQISNQSVSQTHSLSWRIFRNSSSTQNQWHVFRNYLFTYKNSTNCNFYFHSVNPNSKTGSRIRPHGPHSRPRPFGLLSTSKWNLFPLVPTQWSCHGQQRPLQWAIRKSLHLNTVNQFRIQPQKLLNHQFRIQRPKLLSHQNPSNQWPRDWGIYCWYLVRFPGHFQANNDPDIDKCKNSYVW